MCILLNQNVVLEKRVIYVTMGLLFIVFWWFPYSYMLSCLGYLLSKCVIDANGENYVFIPGGLFTILLSALHINVCY